MDNEIKDMLVKLLEGQSRLEGKVTGLASKVTGLEIESRKHSIKFETIEENIKIIAELQSGHKEQIEVSFKNTDSIIEEKTDLIETAIKSISKDVKESIEVLKDITGRHEVDINILKSRPV